MANVFGVFITEKLIDRTKRVTRKLISLDETKRVTEARGKCYPLLWVSWRFENKVWLSQKESTVNIINCLAKDFPNLGVIVDGFSLPYNGTGSFDDVIVNINKNYVPQQKEATKWLAANVCVPVFDNIGVDLCVSTCWAAVTDIYFTVQGSLSHKVSWIANCPGVVHGPFWKHGCAGMDRPVRENELHPICVNATEEKWGAHHLESHKDYDFDWHDAYLELFKICKSIPDKRQSIP